MSNEPKNHHYIPQFLIKKFMGPDDGLVNFYDVKRKEILRISTSEVFKYKNLYKDVVNTPENPLQIEKEFSKYEFEQSIFVLRISQ